MFNMTFLSIQPKRFFVTLLATVFTAVSLYADASEPWRQIGPTGAGKFSSVVADPQDQSIIYAINSRGGIYKTTDSGMSWELIATGFGSGKLQINPNATSTLYYDSAYGGIKKSEDGGHSWNSFQPEANDSNYEHIMLTELTLDPVSSQVLFARDMYLRDHPDYDRRDQVKGGGVSRSLDGGETWQQVNEGLPHSDAGLLVEVTALAVDLFNPELVYAGVIEKRSKLDDPGQQPKRMLYRSLDGGDYWEKLTDYKWTINRIILDPGDTTVMYLDVGTPKLVHRSVDGGVNWRHFVPKVPNSQYYSWGGFETTSPSTLISRLNFDSKLLRSDDRGDTWMSFDSPVSLGSFHYDANSGALVAAAGYKGQGLYKSLDEGETWRRISSGIHDKDIRLVKLGPGNSPSIYAIDAGGRMYRGTDNGDDWVPMKRFWPGSDVTQIPTFLAVDSVTATIYAIVRRHLGYNALRYVFKSHDEGDSWTEMTSTLDYYPDSILTHPWDPSILYMGAKSELDWSRELYRSFDGGETWAVPLGLPPMNNMVPALDLSNPATMYIASEKFANTSGMTPHFMKSTDSGDSWVTRVDGLPRIQSTSVFAIDAFNSDNLVLAMHRGIYKTTDGAFQWWRVDRNWPFSGAPVDILIDPLVSSTIYAATESDGVVRSVDGGVTWEPFSQGQDMGSVYDLEYDVETRTLFAATSYGGVFARQTVDAGTEDYAIFSDPNPIRVCDGRPASALVVWRSPASFPVKVRIGSENGPLFVNAAGDGSKQTGNWVRDGMQFYLLSGDSGEVLAQTTVKTTDSGCTRFTANPNPIQVCEGSVGKTTLSWSLSNTSLAEIRVGSPTGKLRARVGPVGELQTGNWVRDGMQFFLIDKSNQATLGEVTVSHTMDGCAG